MTGPICSFPIDIGDMMPQTPRTMNGHTIDVLLQKVADHLDEYAFHRVIACGSGALLLFYAPEATKTNDLDAFFSSMFEYPDDLRDAIKQVAIENQQFKLAKDWMNDDILRFEGTSGKDEFRAPEYYQMSIQDKAKKYFGAKGGILEVVPVDLVAILLGKLNASRTKDYEHITMILRLLNVSTYDETVDIMKKHVTGLEHQPYWDRLSKNLRNYFDMD